MHQPCPVLHRVVLLVHLPRAPQLDQQVRSRVVLATTGDWCGGGILVGRRLQGQDALPLLAVCAEVVVRAVGCNSARGCQGAGVQEEGRG